MLTGGRRIMHPYLCCTSGGAIGGLSIRQLLSRDRTVVAKPEPQRNARAGRVIGVMANGYASSTKARKSELDEGRGCLGGVAVARGVRAQPVARFHDFGAEERAEGTFSRRQGGGSQDPVSAQVEDREDPFLTGVKRY